METSNGEVALLEVLAEARDLGLLGPGPLEPHVAHARGFVTAFASLADVDGIHGPTGPTGPDRILDLGSGGGIPGLVLAFEWPDAEMVLLDSGARRIQFLDGAVERCGLGDRVTTRGGRAEELGRLASERGRYDLVVARSFGPPSVLAECAAPFLRTGGHLVASEPPAERESSPSAPSAAPSSTARWSVEGLAKLGMVPAGVWRREFGYQVIAQGEPCPDRYPRRSGVPRKRPLF